MTLGLRAYEDETESGLIRPSVWPAMHLVGDGLVRGFAPTDWDEVARCHPGMLEHVWGVPVKAARNEYREGESTSVFAGRKDKADIRAKLKADKDGRFCERCGCWRGMLGSEPSVELFVWHLIVVVREICRVLRDDGVLIINIADSMAGTGHGKGTGNFGLRDNPGAMIQRKPAAHKPATAYGAPHLLFWALKNEGLVVKREMIWRKRSAMPASFDGVRWERHRVKVGRDDTQPGGKDQARPLAANAHDSGPNTAPKWKDCPGCEKCEPNGGLVLRRDQWTTTYGHEWLIQVSKGNRYYADREAVKVGKANPRSVLEFKRSPLKGAHYATFPVALAAFFIKAFTSERGVCPECGAPWARVLKRTSVKAKQLSLLQGTEAEKYRVDTIGWKSTCDCDAGEPVPATVLDPFSGAGTSGVAALQGGRDYIGIEISRKYIDMSIPRLKLAAWNARTDRAQLSLFENE